VLAMMMLMLLVVMMVESQKQKYQYVYSSLLPQVLISPASVILRTRVLVQDYDTGSHGSELQFCVAPAISWTTQG
jgi:NADH:ubiquinone oxidoreductase subunit 6 (subunit J)